MLEKSQAVQWETIYLSYLSRQCECIQPEYNQNAKVAML